MDFCKLLLPMDSHKVSDVPLPKGKSLRERVRDTLLKEAERGRAFNLEEFEDDFSNDWTPFISGLGQCLLGVDENPYAVKDTLVKLILNQCTQLKHIRRSEGETEDQWARRFDYLPRTHVHTWIIYEKLVEPDIPSPGWLEENGRMPVKRYRTTTTTDMTKPPSPSDFAKTGTGSFGIGYIVANEFDPSPDGRAFAKLVPSKTGADDASDGDDTMDVITFLQSLGGSRGLAPWGEKELVQCRYDEGAESVGLTKQGKNVKYAFLNVPGIALPNGEMDGSFTMQSPIDNSSELWPLLVWQNVGTEASPFAGVRQAAATYGFPIATALLGLKINRSDILVPIVVCTGTLIQFGAVFLLEPCFPVYTNVSPVMDLEWFDQAMKASFFFRKAMQVAQDTKAKIASMTVPRNHDLSSMELVLSAEQYFLKVLTPDEDSPFLSFGKESPEYGCRHMFWIFNQLWRRLATVDRSYVVFPRGFRTGDDKARQDEDSCQHTAIIFDNLTWSDLPGGPFQIGMPPAAEDGLIETWKDAVEHAFYVIHQAGIVHVDPYPSNIMWRLHEEKVEVRIIDWDLAHSVQMDGNWVADIKDRMELNAADREKVGWKAYSTVSTDHDCQYLKVLRALEPTAHEDLLIELASNDADRVNSSFRKAAKSIDISTVVLRGYK